MNHVVDVTVYGFIELNLKKLKNICVIKSKRMLQVGTSAICLRRYRSHSKNWNGVHEEKFRRFIDGKKKPGY